jgi:hypothetical protein
MHATASQRIAEAEQELPKLDGKHPAEPKALRLLAPQRGLTEFIQAVHAHEHVNVNVNVNVNNHISCFQLQKLAHPPFNECTSVLVFVDVDVLVDVSGL